MAEVQQHGQHYGHQQQSPTDAIKSMLPDRGPTASQVIAVVTLFPLGGFLLILAGLTLAGTVVGLAVATPVFILFSPVLVPAALTIGLAVTGFLTSGAFGLTGMSSMAYILNYLRQIFGKIAQQLSEKVQQMPDQMESAKRRVQDTAGHLGQRTKEVGQQTARGTQETART
ncbi:Oleosin [Thalictrum thalictroides]|uniref:Oleosin n=1 Tax=Thalictrum thalictroides TaxID=46969 RepID=A0A7J6W7L4_THATH|nr:Oleosin [Thalictrum thalictroides]